MQKLLAALLVMVLAIPVITSAGIQGTDHDFSAEGWNPNGQICIVCHTPHGADPTSGPLWNHDVTGATFELYTGSSMTSVPGQPTGVSKLCLSCHDGTVAINSYGGSTGTDVISGGASIGTSLTGMHPVAITYDSALAIQEYHLRDPSAPSGLGGSITEDMLSNDSVECSSCHNVHNLYNNDKFLVISNDFGSGLCVTCHDM